jgi:hypothetical protein
LPGCVSDNAGSSQPKPAAQNNEKNPEVGMTKDQVIGLYGKTDNMRVGSDGETWIYNLEDLTCHETERGVYAASIIARQQSSNETDFPEFV